MATGGSGLMPVSQVMEMQRLILHSLDMPDLLQKQFSWATCCSGVSISGKKYPEKILFMARWRDLRFPGRYINYKWDGPNMRITNFEKANQFVKREYRKGWGEIKL